MLRIENFSLISFCDKLESLDIGNTYIKNISFLEKNKNIKELELNSDNVGIYTPISYLEKLEKLDLSFSDVKDISFLEKNKNIKELDIRGCEIYEKYKVKILKRKDIYIIEN